MNLPLVRFENIVTQTLDTEILIYDLAVNKAFCLNETSAIVYQACNGKTTFAELKTKHLLSDEIIFLALDELKRQNLLANDTNYQSPFAGMTRREAIRKVGLASMIALPLISSVIAPLAIQAQSGCAAPGTISAVFCTSTASDCNINPLGFVCCSGMTVLAPGACPLFAGFPGCACAAP
jgi:hypothetical protein